MPGKKNTEGSEKTEDVINGIPEIPDNQLSNYLACVLSNEPLVSHYGSKLEGSSVLVGTSCLRSLLIASELSTPENLTKLFIIDNSRQVYFFWKVLKQVVLVSSSETQSEFLDKLLDALNGIQEHIYEKPESVINYFKQLFSKYGYEGIMELLATTVLIKQDWSDTNTFKKLNDYFTNNAFKNVYVYCSNIVGYMTDDHGSAVGNKILENIQLLKPKRSIHTDFVPARKKLGLTGVRTAFRSLSTYVCDDSKPEHVWQKIHSLKSVKPKTDNIKSMIVLAAAFLSTQTDLNTVMRFTILLALMVYLYEKQFLQLQRDPATSKWPAETISSANFFRNKTPLLKEVKENKEVKSDSSDLNAFIDKDKEESQSKISCSQLKLG